MTMHTRYRATMQRALGEVVDSAPLHAGTASAVGAAALAQLEAKGFTLTALPVDGQPTEPTEPDPPWRFEVEQVGGQQPTDYGTGTEDWAEWHWTLSHGPYVVLSGVEVDEDPRPRLTDLVDRLNGRALVGGRPAAPTREQAWRDLAEDAIAYIDTFKNTRPDRGKVASQYAERAALLSRPAAEPPDVAVTDD